MNLIICLAYHSGDQELAQNLINWCNELGGFGSRKLLLAREFDAVKLTGLPANTEEINFRDSYRSWPKSTTLAFSTCARHIEYYSPNESFLWLEPDCCPLKAGWLDELEAEFRQTTKVFMNGLVPEYMGTPAHASGIGIYPGRMTAYAGQALLLDDELPFDLLAIEAVNANAHFSDLIQHRWDRPAKPPVNSMEDIYKVVTTECVLYHGNKDGSWIETLRRERKPEPKSAQPTTPNGNALSPNKSYQPLTEPAEGTESNGMVWRSGAWRQKTFIPKPGTKEYDELPKWLPDPVTEVKRMFTSPLAKGRIMKQLKAAPILKK